MNASSHSCFRILMCANIHTWGNDSADDGGDNNDGAVLIVIFGLRMV